MVRIADSSWPSTVIPGDGHERAQSTGLLFRRMGWVTESLTASEIRNVDRHLAIWYDAGYCPEALLVALNVRPDNTKQKPRRKNESLPDYLRSRMKAWYKDDPDAAMSEVQKPPRPGITSVYWNQKRLRRANDEGTNEYRRPVTKRGSIAREEVKAFAAARRKDPMERMREASARRTAALASLEVDGGTPNPGIGVGAAEELTAPRMVAFYAGRQSLSLLIPRVAQLVQRLRTERRPPTAPERALLRNAVRDARRKAGVGSLEALAAEMNGEEAGILSAQGMQMLAFLEHASPSDMPLEVQLKFLHLAVGYSTDPEGYEPQPFPLSEARDHSSRTEVPQAMDGIGFPQF